MRRKRRLAAPILGLLTLLPALSRAQYEYVADVNYSNLAFNNVAFVPGVTWVLVENTAYDQNGQRFFFLGGPNDGAPWTLYTVNVATGAVLSGVSAPPGSDGTEVSDMEYDNGTDTLYGLYTPNSGTLFFACIDPSTGVVQQKASLPTTAGSTECTYDQQDHWYICSDGRVITVIDAHTGAVLYQPSLPASTFQTDMVYDNTDRKLYAICYTPGPNNTSVNEFDSISLATGAVHPIASLPAFTFPQSYTYCIDEAAQKYIFLGSENIDSTSGCVVDSLYALDLNSGNIVSRVVDPDVNGTIIPKPNMIEFSFDQRRGQLYSLNWDPPQNIVSASIPQVSIAPVSATLCIDSSLLFTAAASPGGYTEAYGWQVNGVSTGPNDSVFIYTRPRESDTVRCILTSYQNCNIVAQDTSNAVVIQVDSTATSVTIAPSTTAIFEGDTVSFDATAVNGGGNPSYVWMVDGAPVDSGSAIFSTSALQQGDLVNCRMTGSLPCSAPVEEPVPVTVTVYPSPVVHAGDDTVVIPGSTVPLDPVIGAVNPGSATYQWEPATGLTNPTAASTLATPPSTTTYSLIVTSGQGCVGEGKLTIGIGSALRMPGAFTPNGDGINDVFQVPAGAPQVVIRFSVFDRWGTQVFTTSSSTTGWDGTFRGQPQPVGSYVWEIEYRDAFTGKPAKATGTVLLIR